MTPRPRCLNCGERLGGRWCSTCGQDGARGLRTLPQLLRDSLGELLNVDGRLRLTLRTLFLRPGRLTRDYVAGRFVDQTPPLRLYLAASAIYFVLAPRLGGGRVVLPGAPDDLGYFVFGPLGWDSQILLLLLAPLSALALAVMLRNPRRPFEALFVFSVHYNVVFLAIISALAGCASLSRIAGIPWLTVGFLALGVVAPLPYLVRSLQVAFGIRGIRLLGTSLAWTIVHLGLGQAIDNTLGFGTPFR